MTGPGRMMIVDDEPAVREVLSDYFSDRGYKVVVAADGPQALATFARERPDVVLLDVRMPGLDGLAVLRLLREADPDAAVIMVTANEDLEVARETLSVGAFDYVAKPFDFDHLSRTVETAIVHSARVLPGDVELTAPPSDSWGRLVTDLFRVVREMSPEARRSTGVRLEEATLAAARQAMAGHFAEAAAHVAEARLLVTVASELGDLSASGRSLVEGVLKTAEAALSPR